MDARTCGVYESGDGQERDGGEDISSRLGIPLAQEGNPDLTISCRAYIMYEETRAFPIGGERPFLDSES